MLKNFRIIIRTLMFVTVVAFVTTVWHVYKTQGEVRAAELIPKLPNFEHENNQQFLENVGMCVKFIEYTTSDVIPVNKELLLAQAALESGWGTSRFAKEGKNLFGIRTYDLREPHMLPWKDKRVKWGVKVFKHECDSVMNYINILNNGSAYEKYRQLREDGIDDPYILVETLDAYASDKHYFSKIKSILTKIRKEYKIQ
jgi:Bax protein